MIQSSLFIPAAKSLEGVVFDRLDRYLEVAGLIT